MGKGLNNIPKPGSQVESLLLCNRLDGIQQRINPEFLDQAANGKCRRNALRM